MRIVSTRADRYKKKVFIAKLTAWVLTLYLLIAPSKSRLRTRLLDLIRRLVTPLTVAVVIAVYFALVVIGNVLQYEGFDATLWDLSTYIQPVYNLAHFGSPVMTLTDQALSAYRFHFSIAVPVLAFLFRIFEDPRILLVWHSIFLFLPALVAMLWYRQVLVRENQTPEPFGYLLAFCTVALLPTFFGQMFWPYMFYLPGMTFLALAYLFYDQKRWVPWALCLVLFTLHKEDFGLMASLFALVALAENFRNKRAIWIQGFVLVFGMVYYYLLTHQSEGVLQFGDRFANLGSSPREALHNLLTHPILFFEQLKQPASLFYVGFFVVCSLWWISPRWSTIRFLVPVIPFILLFASAQMATLHQLKDHYAWPFALSVSATLVLGVFGTWIKRGVPRDRAQVILMLALLFFLLPWGHFNPLKIVSDLYGNWKVTAQERLLTADLKGDREIVLCCEDRLCSRFSDRPYLIPAQYCVTGSMLLSGLRGKKAVFLLNAQSDLLKTKSAANPPAAGRLILPLPVDWPVQTGRLRMSSVVIIGE